MFAELVSVPPKGQEEKAAQFGVGTFIWKKQHGFSLSNTVACLLTSDEEYYRQVALALWSRTSC